MRVAARALAGGAGEGVSIRLSAPLSFWGGTDYRGRIVDAHHPQCGAGLAGRVVVMESGRGSSSSSSVLAEQIRTKAAPAAIVLARPDAIVALGAIVARELYGLDVPIVVVATPHHEQIPAGVLVRVDSTAVMW
jgi:uncharacterized protein